METGYYVKCVGLTPIAFRFVRHSSRQLYCNNWDCQAERNRRNRRASYARKKAKEVENKE